MKRIIYDNNGGISVIVPIDCGLTIEQIAQKDVPLGVPYLIIDTVEVPTDRTSRDLWTADFITPTGYGGTL